MVSVDVKHHVCLIMFSVGWRGFGVFLGELMTKSEIMFLSSCLPWRRVYFYFLGELLMQVMAC